MSVAVQGWLFTEKLSFCVFGVLAALQEYPPTYFKGDEEIEAAENAIQFAIRE